MENKKLVAKISYKPKFSTYVFLLLSFTLLFTGNTETVILGIAFVIIGLIVLFAVKDKRIAEIYEDMILLYYDDKEEYCIPIEEIAEWNTNSGGIFILKKDGNKVFVETHETMKANEALKKVAGHVETIEILREKVRNEKLKFSFRKRK